MRSRPMPTVLSTLCSPAFWGCPWWPALMHLTRKIPPQFTLNQGATEVALAFGVEDQLAGTAYLDDSVPQKWRAAYDSVPVLSKEYPKREELLAAQPDFVYGSYASAGRLPPRPEVRVMLWGHRSFGLRLAVGRPAQRVSGADRAGLDAWSTRELA